ncbi:bifunctional aspartate kinase/homoserine dehydrogenase II [Arsukibacterium indicum]|uniref:Bifunctional aspartate kinase/homoserine dehydrogenase II n=1 Tax=Arsukibacterium indicum TaxID=2848612 RepID=A0ABS6MMN8_9GAMM|nr:bifunctional aspartate kinase/homoserine dehydrogenase II [Arsukibacterium indicum]MBV2130055.1 bifunctional aspartate kinase/homoserine dehydrogenase II [Arsukibacterium indicum]
MSQQLAATSPRNLISVHKFGGSSLASTARFQAVTRLVKQQQGQPWVVVSAPGDTTDELLAIISSYQQQGESSVLIAQLQARLLQLISASLSGPATGRVLATVQYWFSQIPAWLARQQNNEVLAIGELLSATLLAAMLTEQGKPAVAVDARQFLRFNDVEPDWQHSSALLKKVTETTASSGTSANVIHVVTGYIGKNQQGDSITLGRNGSDYSATLLAALLAADSVSIWTDVKAIYSADPRKCASAIPYARVNVRQACQLAALGNPVLHARTLAPLTGSRTSLLVRSALQPEHEGCEVVPTAANQAFLTSLAQVRLVSLARRPQISAVALAEQLQVPVVVLPQQDNGTDETSQRWLIPASAWTVAAALLQQHGSHPLTDTSDYYALVWLKGRARQQVNSELSELLQQLDIQHFYENDQLAVWLFKQELTVTELNQVHQHCVATKPRLQLLVAGTGNVGAEFLQMLSKQQAALSSEIKLTLAGVFNSRRALLGEALNPAKWQDQLACADSYSATELLTYIRQLPGPKVLVDITPSQQFARQYPDFIKAGCHIISANKQGVTLPLAEYNAIRAELKHHQLSWRSNTTVGAGIPVQQVIQTLQQSGDSIKKISGIFSGTLSWLLCKFDGSQPFSGLLAEATELGLTEPDPRDDLSGKDVQRKLLVLARELGLNLELEQIRLQPLMPEALAAGSWPEAWQQRGLLDDMLAKAWANANAAGKVLRYAASLTLDSEGVTAEVTLLQVAADEPLAALTPCDNIFVIESQWYCDNPLVLKGPGAGRQVTAGGIHADVAQLCQQLILTGVSH